jgi:ABC-type polysaccharide transport system permease subunit
LIHFSFKTSLSYFEQKKHSLLFRHGDLSLLLTNYTIIILVYVAWHLLQLMNYFKGLRRAHFLTWRGNFVCLYVIYDAWKAFGFQSINALDLL